MIRLARIASAATLLACSVVLSSLVVTLGGASLTAAAQSLGEVVRLERGIESLLGPGAAVEKIADGFQFIEGPLWIERPGDSHLLFSDIPANRVYRWDADRGTSTFLDPVMAEDADTGAEGGSNGLTLAPDGRLVLFEHGNRRVAILDPSDGERTALVERYQGRRLNSPNDGIFHSNGTLYFTDPPYGLGRQDEDPAKELEWNGIYRRLPDGTVELLSTALDRPNGIGLSPDQRTLYVANSSAGKRLWMAFPVLADGRLGEGRVLHDASSSPDPGVPDGLAVDALGNLWATGPGGVWVLSPAGKHLGTIATAELPANAGFGGEDGQTLFITARTGLYRIRTSVTAASPTAKIAGATAKQSLLDFDAYVAQAVRDWQAPGLAVAVVAGGEVVFEKGYGVLELGGDDPVDEHTLFSIGSTTKAMTAALVALLVEDGKIAWDDRVIDHLPWFRVDDAYVTRELRVRDLLTHNGGMPNTDFLWYEQDNTTREIVERMRFVPPATSMRSEFTYQNVMYATAGLLIEAVSGQSWDEVLRTRLFEPLGMTRSVPLLADTAQRSNVATPHDFVDGTLVPIENASVDSVAAAGSVWSSVHEMAQWSRMLLADGKLPDGRQLLAEESIAAIFRPWTMVEPEDFYPTAELTRPHWTTYGLAWFQADYEGRRVDFHTGSIDGLVAIHGLLRDEGVGVIVLANRDHVELRHALMYRVFDLLGPSHGEGQPARDWSAELKVLYDRLAEQGEAARQAFLDSRVEGTSSSLEPRAFAGVYEDELYGRVDVHAEGNTLVLHYGRRTAELEHWQYDTFSGPWQSRWRGRAQVTFRLGRDGAPASLDLDGSQFERRPDDS